MSNIPLVWRWKAYNCGGCDLGRRRDLKRKGQCAQSSSPTGFICSSSSELWAVTLTCTDCFTSSHCLETYPISEKIILRMFIKIVYTILLFMISFDSHLAPCHCPISDTCLHILLLERKFSPYSFPTHFWHH